MKYAKYINGLMCVGLAGCGVSYPSRPIDSAYLNGANGLEYAEAGLALSDIEEQTISVTVARFLRDSEGNDTVVVISDEVATLPVGFTAYEARDMVITLDGETLTFVDGQATLESGQTVWGYLNYALAHSATGGLYTYGKYASPSEGEAIDTEGFFAIGFQTNPDDILVLSGDATYRGSYFGYGQLLDADGGLLNDELETNGAITIEVDFKSASASGQLNGFFDPKDERDQYSMIFVNAAINGNGFAAAPDMICEAGADCKSATSLGAVFYGDAGAELSGVIGFDETIVLTDTDTTTRFIGAAGFSSTREVTAVEVPAD